MQPCYLFVPENFIYTDSIDKTLETTLYLIGLFSDLICTSFEQHRLFSTPKKRAMQGLGVLKMQSSMITN